MSSAAHIREHLSGGSMPYRASQHHHQGVESGQAARYNPAPSVVTDVAGGIRGYSYQPYQSKSDHHDQNAAGHHHGYGVQHYSSYELDGDESGHMSSRQPQQYSSHDYQPQPQQHQQQTTTSFRSASSLAYSGMNNAESLFSDSANYNVSVVHNRLPSGAMRGGGYLRPPSSRPPSPPRGATTDSAEYLNSNTYYHSAEARPAQHVGNNNNNISNVPEVTAVARGQPAVTYVHQDYGVRRVSPTRAGTGQYFPSNLSRHTYEEEVNYQRRAAGAGADVGDVVATPTASFAVPPPPDPTPFHITPPYSSHQPISMNNASDAFYHHHHNQQHIDQVQGQQQQQQRPQYFGFASSHNPASASRPVAIAETRLTNIAQDVGATAALHAAMSEMEKAKNAEIRALEEENAALREMLEREAEAREVAVKALCSEAATASYLTHAARKRDLQAAFWHWRMRQYKRQSQRMSKTIVQTYDAVSATISKSSVVVDAKAKSISKAVRELAAAEQLLVMRRIEFFSNIDACLPDDAVLGQPSRSGNKEDKSNYTRTGVRKGQSGQQRRADRPTEEELLGEVLSSPVRRQKERIEKRRSGNRRTKTNSEDQTSRSSSSSSSSSSGKDDANATKNKKAPSSKKKERRSNRWRKNEVTDDDDEKDYSSSDTYSVPDHIVLLHEVTRQYKDLSIAYANDVDIVVQKRMGVVAAYLEAIADQLNLASSLRNHLRPFDAVAKTVLGLRGQLNERVARSRAEAALELVGGGGVEGAEKASSTVTATAASTTGGSTAHHILRDANTNSNSSSSMPYPQPANPLDYTPSLVAYASALDVYKDAYHGTITVTALPPLLNLLRAGIERVVGGTDANGEHSFDDEDFGFNLQDFSPAPRRVPTALGTTVMNLEDPLRNDHRGVQQHASPHAAQTMVKAVASYFYDGLEQVMLQSPMTATANKVLVHYLDAHVRLPPKGGSLLSGEDGGTDNEHAALASGTLDAPVELSRCRLYINPLVKSTRTFTEEMAYLRREGVAAAAEAKAWGLRAEEAAAMAVGNTAPFEEVNSTMSRANSSPPRGATRGATSTFTREASSSSAAGWSGAGGPSAARVAGVLNDRGTATSGRSRSGASDSRQPSYRVVVVGDGGGVVAGSGGDGGGAALISRASPLRTQRQGPQYDADEVAAQLADSLIMKDSKNPLRNKWDGVGGFTSNPLSHIAHIVGRRSPVRPQPQPLGRSNSFTFSGTGVGGGGYSLSGGGSLPRSSSVPHATAPNIPPIPSAQQHAAHHYPNASHSSYEAYSRGAGPGTPLTRALSNPSIQNQADPSFYHNNYTNGVYHRAETPISSRQNSQPRGGGGGGGGVGGDELGFNPQQQLQFTPISGPNGTAPQQQQQRPQYYVQPPTGFGLPPTARISTSSAVAVPAASGVGGSLSRAASPHPYSYAVTSQPPHQPSYPQQGVRGGEGGIETPSTASEGYGKVVQPSLYSVRPPAGAASSQSLVRARSQSDEGTTAAFREPSRDGHSAQADREGARRATAQSLDNNTSSLTSSSSPSREHREGDAGDSSVATVPKTKPTTTTAPTNGGIMDREGVSGPRQSSVDVETVSSVSGTNTRDNSPIRGGSTTTTVIGGSGTSHS